MTIKKIVILLGVYCAGRRLGKELGQKKEKDCFEWGGGGGGGNGKS